MPSACGEAFLDILLRLARFPEYKCGETEYFGEALGAP
jgi:hypothetical protein